MSKQVTTKDERTSYQRAYDEWEARIGSTRAQLRNWRLACLLILVVAILLLVGIIQLISKQKDYVYIAQLGPKENVVNVRSLDKQYEPTEAQEEYFVSRFIENIMTLPLDPVIARQNWLSAYQLVSGKAKDQLTRFARINKPLSAVGRETKSIEIKDYHPIGDHSYNFTWTQTTYGPKGVVKSVDLYDGIFTVVQGQQPATAKQMLKNPLGLRIVYFSFSEQGR